MQCVFAQINSSLIFKITLALFHGFVRGRVKRRFVITNVCSYGLIGPVLDSEQRLFIANRNGAANIGYLLGRAQT
jgi:hypothetical protein